MTASVNNLFVGNSMEIAKPVTHSVLDYFEKPEVLINYEGAFDQEGFPHVGCHGPQLDFFVAAEAKNLIDLNCSVLAVYQEDGKTKVTLMQSFPTILTATIATYIPLLWKLNSPPTLIVKLHGPNVKATTI